MTATAGGIIPLPENPKRPGFLFDILPPRESDSKVSPAPVQSQWRRRCGPAVLSNPSELPQAGSRTWKLVNYHVQGPWNDLENAEWDMHSRMAGPTGSRSPLRSWLVWMVVMWIRGAKSNV